MVCGILCGMETEEPRVLVQLSAKCHFCGEEFYVTQKTWNYCDIGDKALEDFLKEHEDCEACPPSP